MITAQEARVWSDLALEFDEDFTVELESTFNSIYFEASKGNRMVVMVADGMALHWVTQKNIPKLYKYFDRTDFTTEMNKDATTLTIYW